MAERMPQIVALGGGGFSMEKGPLLDDYVLAAAATESPKVCFLPTASGDADHYIVRFYRAFAAGRCVPSHVSLFRRDRGFGDLGEHLLGQDVIYVGGGSLVRLLGAWRAHGLDEVLAECWRRGVVLAGLSAGSLCWFAEAITAFHGPAQRVNGLGLLPYANCVHYDGEPERREAFRRLAVRRHARRLRRGRRSRVALRRPRPRAGGDVAARGDRPSACTVPTASSPRPRSRRRTWDRSPLPDRPRRILAMGGGGFTMEPGNPSLDEFILTLSDAARPKILFLPTASGDPAAQIARFYAAYDRRECEPTVLSLFRLVDGPVPLPRDPARPGRRLRRRRLDAQPPGDLARACARRDPARGVGGRRRPRRAERGGDVLVRGGASTKSTGCPAPVAGLGLLPGSLCVHYDGEPERRPVFLDSIRAGTLPGGWAADDGAGLLFEERDLVRVVSSRERARAFRVQRNGDHVVETQLHVDLLERRAPAVPLAIRELRDLRTLRARG